MKTQIQKPKSSKLYYRKWPFKIECKIAGASSITRQGLNTFVLSKQIDRAKLSAFAAAVEPFLSRKDLQFRTEGVHFNLFCKDMSVLEEIDSALHPWIIKITGPTTKEELDFLLENGPKKILCDKLPKDQFKYRIYFKTKFPPDKKISFLTWADSFDDRIIVSPTSKAWLSGQRMWAQDPFAYVKDEKTLSMIGLQLTGYVKRVEQFVERKQALVT